MVLLHKNILVEWLKQGLCSGTRNSLLTGQTDIYERVEYTMYYKKLLTFCENSFLVEMFMAS